MAHLHRHLSVAALSLLAACGSTPVAPPSPPATQPMPAAAPAAPAPRPDVAPLPTPESAVKAVKVPPYLDPRSSLSTARSVYFEFDDALVKRAFTTLVETHGRYLAAHPALNFRIEGNADDRDSAEYILAPGQKRAQALMRALEIFGMRDSQVELVSCGEEEPKASGHDESAWAQNRRADLQHPSK